MLRSPEAVVFGAAPVTLEQVADLACRRARPLLSGEPEFVSRIEASRRLVDEVVAAGGVIYGVTTGYGDSCEVRIPPTLVAELPMRLATYHGCGMGRILERDEARAVLAARLASLVLGASGVRMELLDALASLLEADVLPAIPAEGSVGASGDLTPLSYVAAVLCGEREVLGDEGLAPARAALLAAGIDPLQLRPKEGLALMNGTAVMTGLACLAWSRADYLGRLAARITAASVAAMDGHAQHYDERLMALKPHRGPQRVAERIRRDLGRGADGACDRRLQDRYSLRCAPHVIGVLDDALDWMRRDIENELNSANDNPLVDVESGRILHGGHFYGGHIAFAMDGLKAAVANVADLLDRQLALLVDTRYNNGLPANLSAARSERAAVNHGLKALQIAVSAWTAEALKNTMPASVFSRSTECHNQDKVSMGTIAARDALRVLELAEQVAAAMLIAVRQALALRHGGAPEWAGPGLRAMYEDLERSIALVDEDRRLDLDLQLLVGRIRNRDWTLEPAPE